jgi:hypothetical protein
MKNPFLSMWLSQANAWSGAMRGLWSAELQRQQTQMMNEMTKQVMRFWTGGGWMRPSGSPAPRQRRTGGARS